MFAPTCSPGPVPDRCCPPSAYPGLPERKRLPPGSVDTIERALWFGTPYRALTLLGERVDDPRTAWLRGVALLSIGRYDAAERALRPALADTGRYPALAAAALASADRQRQRYAGAAELDALALSAAGTDVEAGADALIGLTADAIGAGDLGTAAARLTELDTLGHTGWRAGIRRYWVVCELALASGRPEHAARAAHVAVRRAELVQASRHIAKSLLFYGVSVREVARRQAVTPLFRSAAVILGRAERLAAAVGSFPVLGVACQQRLETLKEVAVTGDAVAQNTYIKTAS